jgi:alanine dehydrogenase
LPYLLLLAGKGWRQAVHEDDALARGVNVTDGRVTSAPVAAAHRLEHSPLAA